MFLRRWWWQEMGDIDWNILILWYFTESCILIEDCPPFLNESERLGNWNINFRYYFILIFLSLNSSELYSVTSEGSLPVNSEDYTELYDSLNDQYCDEEKVCCPENVRILHQILLLSTFYDNFSWKSTRDKMFVDQKKQENTPGWLALWDTVFDSLFSLTFNRFLCYYYLWSCLSK